MNENQLRSHIAKRKKEQKEIILCLSLLEELKENGLSDSSYNEVNAKLNSRYAFCERSIRDHKKDLEKITQ